MNPFITILKSYPNEKINNPTAAKRNSDPLLHAAIFENIPSLIKKWMLDIDINPSRYKIKPSIGQGNIAEIPWIACLNKDVTSKASQGYYIVFLFSADNSFFYLNLAQAVTKNNDGSPINKLDLDLMPLYAQIAQKNISNTNDNNEYLGPINLKAKGDLGKKYGKGTIKGYKYSLLDIQHPKFWDKLRRQFLNLLKDYETLITLCGNNLQNLHAPDESSYQTLIQYPLKTPGYYSSIPPRKKTISLQYYIRNTSISQLALARAEYKCEFNNEHTTFKNTHGYNYVEGHHLIPLSNQGNFIETLDIAQNIIALCPNCHRKIHHAQIKEQHEMLEYFYEKRSSDLKKMGLNISLSNLKNYYMNNKLDE